MFFSHDSTRQYNIATYLHVESSSQIDHLLSFGWLIRSLPSECLGRMTWHSSPCTVLVQNACTSLVQEYAYQYWSSQVTFTSTTTWLSRVTTISSFVASLGSIECSREYCGEPGIVKVTNLSFYGLAGATPGVTRNIVALINSLANNNGLRQYSHVWWIVSHLGNSVALHCTVLGSRAGCSISALGNNDLRVNIRALTMCTGSNLLLTALIVNAPGYSIHPGGAHSHSSHRPSRRSFTFNTQLYRHNRGCTVQILRLQPACLSRP